MNDDKKNESSDEEKLNIAATKIQSTYRGYKTRSQIKNNKINTNTKLNENSSLYNKKYEFASKKSKEKKINQDQAAIKIQSTFRGYKTRKQLDLIKTKKLS